MLRGLGGVAVGLPFLEEMAVAESVAKVPTRAFNVFFGLGVPAPLQQEGYEGVLEPLAPLADKLAILRGIDHTRCDEDGVNAHFDGSSAAFTATPPNGEAKAGGGSIDQVVRRIHHPHGLPAGMVPTLVAGTFFRRSRVSRYVHSYNPDGTVAAVMQESPRQLFDRVFGQLGDDTGGVREQRLRQSVLDAVVDQYRHFTGKRSPLGQVSRGRVRDHLDRVREYEQRAYQMEADAENAPPRPVRSDLPHGGLADPGGQGIDITLDELSAEWRLLADLYSLAIKMDRARFGSITFLAAGERIRLKGDYVFNGDKRFEFDDAKQLNASGDKGCSHEWWHQFNPDKRNQALRAHAHMKLREVAYFLQALDDAESREANGRSILENSLITVSTESGDGRHNDPRRELSGIFHAVSGANGRFKTGEIVDVDAEGLDVYNTMLTAMGSGLRLGPAKREARAIDRIRA